MKNDNFSSECVLVAIHFVFILPLVTGFLAESFNWEQWLGFYRMVWSYFSSLIPLIGEQLKNLLTGRREKHQIDGNNQRNPIHIGSRKEPHEEGSNSSKTQGDTRSIARQNLTQYPPKTSISTITLFSPVKFKKYSEKLPLHKTCCSTGSDAAVAFLRDFGGD